MQARRGLFFWADPGKRIKVEKDYWDFRGSESIKLKKRPISFSR
jgi:hypothetical protein